MGGGTRERSRSRGREPAAPLVPVIDISGLSSPDVEQRRALAKVIGKACEDIGFFVVTNHGIPADVISAAWDRTIDFFDLPLEEKLALAPEDEKVYPYGYQALGLETLSVGKLVDKAGGAGGPASGDLKEIFNMGPGDPASGMPPRRMPARPEGFTAAWEAYYEAANALARRLLRAFALALDLEEDWFEAKVDRHISALRANNYPDQKGMVVPPGSIRCSAHTDYGTVTILRPGGPGLQVSKDKDDPDWQDVPFVEDCFVINLGDLMRRWTNERWSSTLHRVINPPTEQSAVWGRRLALAFFHNLNKDALVEAIPSCISEAQPPLYDPIVAGEFLMLKHLASSGKADPNAHFQKRTSAPAA